MDCYFRVLRDDLLKDVLVTIDFFPEGLVKVFFEDATMLDERRSDRFPVEFASFDHTELLICDFEMSIFDFTEAEEVDLALQTLRRDYGVDLDDKNVKERH